MWEFLRGLTEVVGVLWNADDRPEARRFTLGCAALALAIAVAVALCYR